jgi:adenosylcobyric acid synthase
MVQGCTSDAGKTTLVAGLCRLLARQGHSVAPFKPQNMALNSAVTEDGGEIGRAQALQAIAANIPLSVHLNPVLLKPNSDTGAQVILQGHSVGNLNAVDYHDYKSKANEAVLDSFQTLCAQYHTILVEGAGSPAEINLRENDIANMGFAEQVDCPVILIADIDKGGVFAHIIGTLACLSQSEQQRIKGFVINRFRGDKALLQSGLDWLEARTGKPVLGVLPYLHGLHLDAEDAVSQSEIAPCDQKRFKVIMPLLPHISNHTDFEPLRLHPEIDFQLIRHQETIPPADLIILPGSKNVINDLQWLKSQGWEKHLKQHLRYGGKVIGICGGLQMLGKWILDPEHIEGKQDKQAGLELFDYQTTLKPHKTLTNVTGQLLCHSNANAVEDSATVLGYEIHAGHTTGYPKQAAIQFKNGATDGAISDDNQLLVSYLHGLFDQPKALTQLLSWAGFTPNTPFDIHAVREQQLERLADSLENNLKMDLIFDILKQTPIAPVSPIQNAFLPHQIEAVYQTIQQRRDMRHFLKQPIQPALLERLLNAAHNAPSVGLMQPWRFIRITQRNLRQQLHTIVEKERLLTATALNKCKDEFMKLKVQGILECAEVIVVSLSDKRSQEVFGRRTLPEMDVASIGCAIQNLALAARAEGIGVGWVSIFDPLEVAECLNIPSNEDNQEAGKPVAILCLGHVKEFYPNPMLERENWRKPLSQQQVVFYNQWQKTSPV